MKARKKTKIARVAKMVRITMEKILANQIQILFKERSPEEIRRRSLLISNE